MFERWGVLPGAVLWRTYRRSSQAMRPPVRLGHPLIYLPNDPVLYGISEADFVSFLCNGALLLIRAPRSSWPGRL